MVDKNGVGIDKSILLLKGINKKATFKKSSSIDLTMKPPKIKRGFSVSLPDTNEDESLVKNIFTPLNPCNLLNVPSEANDYIKELKKEVLILPSIEKKHNTNILRFPQVHNTSAFFFHDLYLSLDKSPSVTKDVMFQHYITPSNNTSNNNSGNNQSNFSDKFDASKFLSNTNKNSFGTSTQSIFKVNDSQKTITDSSMKSLNTPRTLGANTSDFINFNAPVNTPMETRNAFHQDLNLSNISQNFFGIPHGNDNKHTTTSQFFKMDTGNFFKKVTEDTIKGLNDLNDSILSSNVPQLNFIGNSSHKIPIPKLKLIKNETENVKIVEEIEEIEENPQNTQNIIIRRQSSIMNAATEMEVSDIYEGNNTENTDKIENTDKTEKIENTDKLEKTKTQIEVKKKEKYQPKRKYKKRIKTLEAELELRDKGKKYMCLHPDCRTNFRTKREKILHHNKIDTECRVEKQNIIKLISKYKNGIIKLVRNAERSSSPESKRWNKLDDSANHNKSLMEKLKEEFIHVKRRLIDYEYFNSNVGINFDDEFKQ